MDECSRESASRSSARGSDVKTCQLLPTDIERHTCSILHRMSGMAMHKGGQFCLPAFASLCAVLCISCDPYVPLSHSHTKISPQYC